MSSSYRKYPAPLIAILSIVACSLIGTGTASAGSNGQKINYYNRSAYGQCTVGKNQSNETVQNCTQLHAGANPEQTHWWVDQVEIHWYYADNTYSPSFCTVPRSQEGNDYSICHDPTY